MANPATLLYQQLAAWNAPNQTADQVRKPASDGWETQRLMVRHLDAIDEMLRTLEANGRNVSVYRRTFPGWCQAVFAFPSGWSAGNSGAINEQHLGHLETLAERLDGEIPVADESLLVSLSDYLTDVRGVLASDTDLPDELRDHLAQVITHAEWCVNNYAISGDFELRVATERLGAVIGQVSARSRMTDMWDTVKNNFVWPFAVGLATDSALTAAAQFAIGG